MFRHNFLILYRNFRRFRSTFVINLIGLSAGLACAMMIYLWVADELRMDKFHEKDERLFQVFERQEHAGSVRVTNSTPWLLADALKAELPEVEHAAMVTPGWYAPFILSQGTNHVRASGRYAGEDFFHLFSWKLIEGKRESLLQDKQSIVITRELAMRLFNRSHDLVGQTITWQHERDFVISGVIENPPAHSSQRFDFVLAFDVLKETMADHSFSWENSGPFTYLTLKEGSDAEDFVKKAAGIIKTKTAETHRTIFITPFSDTYLYGKYENGVLTGGRIDYVKQFALLAFVILVVACINFMNLSTAKATRRLKEVGIKKALGAGRKSLAIQHLTESLLMSIIALMIAVVIVEMAIPSFNEITEKHLELNLSFEVVMAALAITTFTGLLSGSYPALYLSGFRPADVFKGKQSGSASASWARKALVVSQFSISVLLIVIVVVILQQIDFIRHHHLGYNKENVIYFEMEGPIRQKREAFITEIKKLPGVVNASSVAQSMVGGGNTTEISWPGKDADTRIPFFFRPVNYDAIEMLDLDIVEGRSFSRDYADTLQVIFNETAIATMGLTSPIGQQIDMGSFTCEIVGVVKDFHFESLHTPIGPLLLVLTPHYTQKFIARIEAGQVPETVERIQALYQQWNPGFTFTYRFLDEDFQRQYAAEQRTATLSRYFAGLAILISCLGLFGLAAFTAARRTKEIGIRKVLGSTTLGIVVLLSREFTRMVVAGIVIALPLSFLVTRQWLNDFTFRINLEWWHFAGPGLAALLIAWFTVALQTWKAARVNPAVCLKDE